MRAKDAQAVLEIADNAFVSLDGEGRVLEWNPRAEELFGYSREEAIGATLAELIIPERYRALHRSGLERARTTDETGVFRRQLSVEAVRRRARSFERAARARRCPSDGRGR